MISAGYGLCCRKWPQSGRGHKVAGSGPRRCEGRGPRQQVPWNRGPARKRVVNAGRARAAGPRPVRPAHLAREAGCRGEAAAPQRRPCSSNPLRVDSHTVKAAYRNKAERNTRILGEAPDRLSKRRRKAREAGAATRWRLRGGSGKCGAVGVASRGLGRDDEVEGKEEVSPPAIPFDCTRAVAGGRTRGAGRGGPRRREDMHSARWWWTHRSGQDRRPSVCPWRLAGLEQPAAPTSHRGAGPGETQVWLTTSGMVGPAPANTDHRPADNPLPAALPKPVPRRSWSVERRPDADQAYGGGRLRREVKRAASGGDSSRATQLPRSGDNAARGDRGRKDRHPHRHHDATTFGAATATGSPRPQVVGRPWPSTCWRAGGHSLASTLSPTLPVRARKSRSPRSTTPPAI